MLSRFEGNLAGLRFPQLCNRMPTHLHVPKTGLEIKKRGQRTYWNFTAACSMMIQANARWSTQMLCPSSTAMRLTVLFVTFACPFLLNKLLCSISRLSFSPALLISTALIRLSHTAVAYYAPLFIVVFGWFGCVFVPSKHYQPNSALNLMKIIHGAKSVQWFHL